MRLARALVVVMVAVLTCVLVGTPSHAQQFSLDPLSPTIAPLAPYLAGPPCGLAGPFSPAGDITALGPPLIVIPSGPAGCGLGLVAPANVNAYSSGLGPPAGFPIPPGAVGFAFSVDAFATGDAVGAACGVPPFAGAFPPDVGSESGDLTIGGSSDAEADVFANYAGPAAPLPAAAPLPGTMPHTQIGDGDALAAPPFFFAPVPPGAGVIEPGPGGDNVDAVDISAPLGAIDFIGPDGVPDVNVYFSLDGPTAGPAAGAGPGDILTAIGGGFGLYAPAAALGLVAGDDVDALYVTDFVAPPGAFALGDTLLFSLAPGSPSTLGGVDCSIGYPIGEGQILTDPATCCAFGFPFAGCCVPLAPPCLVSDAGAFDLWDGAVCGPNPAGAAEDNMDGLDLLPAPVAPPPTPVPTIPPATATPTFTPPAATATPTFTPPAAATCTPVPPPVGPTPTPGNAKAGNKCQRTIAKEVSKFVKAKLKILDKCHNSILKDKIADPGPGGGMRLAACLSDPTTAAKLLSASSKTMAKIAGKCGGADKTCGNFDTDEELPVDLGFDATCPTFEGSCAAAITDCDDLATCVDCIADAAIDQSMVLYYDAMIDVTVGSAINKCQQTIGKETTKYFLAKEKLLLKCKDAHLKGKHSDFCPDVTAPTGSVAEKTAVKIAKAESKKITKICKSCGGASKTCDATVTLVNPGGPISIPGVASGDDLSPAAIGFPASCTGVTLPPVPGRPATPCGGAVSTLADLVTCVDCVTEFKADCIDEAARPQFTSYPCECK